MKSSLKNCETTPRKNALTILMEKSKTKSVPKTVDAKTKFGTLYNALIEYF